jgi:hypothetical protein
MDLDTLDSLIHGSSPGTKSKTNFPDQGTWQTFSNIIKSQGGSPQRYQVSVLYPTGFQPVVHMREVLRNGTLSSFYIANTLQAP